ncbi:MAG: T9SS type A sorting domain-containing protein [Bacteroidia bacterium]|nr:T9SS type A sorting domain-containing protein [Bacteroidia bacterium]
MGNLIHSNSNIVPHTFRHILLQLKVFLFCYLIGLGIIKAQPPICGGPFQFNGGVVSICTYIDPADPGQDHKVRIKFTHTLDCSTVSTVDFQIMGLNTNPTITNVACQHDSVVISFTLATPGSDNIVITYVGDIKDNCTPQNTLPAGQQHNLTFTGVPPPTFTISQVPCVGQQVTVNFTQTAPFPPNTNFNWTINGGGTPPTATGQNFTGPISWSTPGPKTITLQASPTPGCGNTYGLTFNVSNPPTVNINAPNSVCVDQITSIGGSPNYGGATYVWDCDNCIPNITGTNAGPHNVSWNSAGTKNITLQVTTSTGCVIPTVSKVITVNPRPTASFNNTVVGCTNQITTITGTAGNMSYNWNCGGCTPNIGSNTAGPFNVSWTTEGTKTVVLTVTNSHGCQSPSFTQAIPIYNPPVASFANVGPLCVGQTGNLQYNGPPLTNAVYQWNCDGCTPSTIPTTQGPHQISWGTPGQKTVSLLIIQGQCSSVVYNQIVTVYPIPASTFITPFNVCAANNVTITYTGLAGNNATYTWNCANCLPLPTTKGPHTVTWQEPGTKTLTLTVTENGCTSPVTSVIITVNPIPSNAFSVSANPICTGQSSVINYTGGAGTTAIFSWNCDGCIPNINSITTSGSFNVTWSTAGVKSVRLAVTENGCTSPQSTVLLTVNQTPSALFSIVQPVCPNRSTKVTYQGNGSAAATYTWGCDGCIGGNPTTQGPHNLSWSSEGSKNITLIVNENGCTSPAHTVSITVHPIPANPTATNKSRCGPGSVILDGSPGTGASVLRWYADNTTSNVLAESNAYQTPYLPANSVTTFYVSSYNTSTTCESPRVAVTATTIPLPGTPIINPVERCGPGIITITPNMGNPIGSRFRLYTSTSSSVLPIEEVSPPNSFTILNLTATTPFYISVFNEQTGCESQRIEVLATIYPLPGNPSVDPVFRCGPSNVTFTAFMGSPSGDDIRLFGTSTSLINPIATSGGPVTYQLTAFGVVSNTTYYIRAFKQYSATSTCFSDPVEARAIINPVPGTPVVPSASRCGPGTITISASMGLPPGNAIRLFTATLPANITPALTVTSLPYNFVRTINTTTTFYIDVFDATTQCASEKVPVVATVNPIPGTPEVPSVPVCGTGSVVFSPSMGTPAGSEVRLYDSANNLLATAMGNFQVSSPVVGTTTTFYISSYNAATQCESAKQSAVAVVHPTPGAPPNITVTGCGTSQVSFTASMGNPPGTRLALYSFTSGAYSFLEADASAPYLFSTPAGTTSVTYYLRSENESTGCNSSFTPLEVKVFPKPSLPAANIPPRCGTGAVTFTANMGVNGGTQIRLFSTLSTSEPISVASNAPYVLTTQPLAPRTMPYDFYLSVLDQSTGCESDRQTIQVQVNENPERPVASNIVNCGAGVITITATMGNPPGTIIKLYAANGNEVSGTLQGNLYSFVTFLGISPTTYFAEVINENTGCKSERRAITATINPIPAAPLVSNVSRCGPGTVTITAVFSGGTGIVRLYTTQNPIIPPIQTDNFEPYVFVLNDVQTTTVYFLEGENSLTGCKSPRSAVNVTINPLPQPPQAPPVSRCGTGAVTITATLIQGDYVQLFDSPVGGVPISTAAPPTIELVTNTIPGDKNTTVTTTYYLEAVNNTTGCKSNRNTVLVNVNPNPGLPVVNRQARCEAGIISFTAGMGVPPGNQMLLYDNANNLLQSVNPNPNFFFSQEVTSTTTLYLRAFNTQTNCISEPQILPVTIHPNPPLPLVVDESRCGPGRVTFTVNPIAAQLVNFYDQSSTLLQQDVTAPFILTTPELSAPATTFWVESKNIQTGCISQRKQVVAYIKEVPGAPAVDDVQRCGSGFGTFTATMGNPPADVMRLYDAGGNLLQSVSGGPTYNLSFEVSNTTLFKIASFNSNTNCLSPFSDARIIVNPRPPTPRIEPITLCGGAQPITFTALVADAGGIEVALYQHSMDFPPMVVKEEVPFLLSLAQAPVGTTTYYGVARDKTTGCESFPTIVTSTLHNNPSTPLADNVNRCGPGMVTFTAILTSGNMVRMYTEQIGGIEIRFDDTDPYWLTSPFLNSTSTFYLEGFDTKTGCRSERVPVIGFVNRIPINPEPTSNEPLCVGQTLTLYTPPQQNTSFVWKGPLDFVAGGNQVSRFITSAAMGGPYTVMAISDAGCSSAVVATFIEVTPFPEKPVATYYNIFQREVPLCVGSELNLSVLNYPNYPIGTKFEWFGPNGFIPGIENQTNRYHPFPAINAVTLNDAGTYSVRAIVGSCTSEVGEVVVNIYDKPLKPTIFSNAPLCRDSTLILQVSGDPNIALYYWIGPDRVFSGVDVIRRQATRESAGIYKVYGINNYGCISDTTSIQVEIIEPPRTVTPVGNLTYCEGQLLTLTVHAEPGVVYTWRSPAGEVIRGTRFTKAGVTLQDAGVYSVVASRGGCALSPATLPIVVNPTPASPSVLTNSPICQGEVLRMTAVAHPNAVITWNGPDNWYWEGDKVVKQNALSADGGAYQVRARLGNCISPATVVNVTIKDVPYPPTVIGDDFVCIGGTLNLSASGLPGADFIWSGPNGFNAMGATPSRATLQRQDAGAYSVVAVMNGCTSNPSIVRVNVVELPELPVIRSNAPICEGQTLQLSTTTLPGYRYFWQGPGGFTSTLASPRRNGMIPQWSGMYSLTLIYAGCSSFTNTAPIIVHPLPTPPAIFTDQPKCVGENLTLTALSLQQVTFLVRGPNNFFATNNNNLIRRNNLRIEDAGLYSVVAIANGCTSQPAVVNVNIKPIPEAPIASSNSPVCVGQTLILSAYNDFVVPNYYWLGPNGFVSRDGFTSREVNSTLDAGIYTVVAIENGCTSARATTTVEILEIPELPVATSNSPLCLNSTLILNVANPVAGVQYEWSGPSNFSATGATVSKMVFSEDDAGDYLVVARRGQCQSQPGAVTVLVRSLLAPPTVASNSEICSGQTLNLFASAIPGATYRWVGPNGFTSTDRLPFIPNATPENSGIYFVTAFVGQCTSEVAQVAVSVIPTPPIPIASSNSPICEGQTLRLHASTIPGVTYFWSGPNGFSASTQTPIIERATTLDEGTYNVYAAIGNCTSATSSTVVRVAPSPPTPIITSNKAQFCEGETLQLNATTIPGAVYRWSGPDNFFSSLERPVRSNLAPWHSGQYNLVVSIGSCSSRTESIIIQVIPRPQPPRIGSNSPICQGGTLQLSSTPVSNAQILWSGPNLFSSTAQNPIINSVTANNAGLYSLVAFVGLCSSQVVTTRVIIDPAPLGLLATANSPVCVGQTTNLEATNFAGASYSWSGPFGFTSTLRNPQILNTQTTAAGIYTVTARIGNCSSSTTTRLEVAPAPGRVSIASNSPICAGQTLELTAANINGATYTWRGPNGFTSTLQNPTISNAQTHQSGTYSLIATVGFCSSQVSTISVNVNPSPGTIQISGQTQLCRGQRLDLNATIVPSAFYTWRLPDGNIITGSNLLISNPPSGVYTLEVAIGNCREIVTTRVTVNDPPRPASLGNNGPLCAGTTLRLTAPEFANARYHWSGPAGFSSTQRTPAIANVTTDYSGTYSLIVSVGGCSSSLVTTRVLVEPKPEISIGSNSPVCEGTNLQLTASSIVDATYHWEGPSGFISQVQNPLIPNVNRSAGGTYSLLVRIGNCQSDTLTTFVNVIPKPSMPLAGSNSPVCSGQTLNLTAALVAGASYQWVGPGGFASTQQNPSIANVSPSQAGTYFVFTIIEGCSSAARAINVTVNRTPSGIQAGNNGPVCRGQEIQLTATSVAGANYTWSGPQQYNSSEQNPILPLNAASGVYSVMVVVGNCTSAITTTSVQILNQPQNLVANYNGPVCEGRELQLTASTIAGATYRWIGPAGFSALGQNVIVDFVSTTAAGTYTVIASIGRCSSSATVKVAVTPTPSGIQAGNNGPTCSGSTLSLSATSVAGASYEWYGPQGFSSTLQNPVLFDVTTSQAGVYTLVVRIGNCYSEPVTTEVSIIPSPQGIQAGNNGPLCAGSILNLTATTFPGATYSWTGPGGFQSAQQNPRIVNANTLASGTYTVTATIEGCSRSATTSVVINLVPSLSTVGNNGPVCLGGELQLYAPTIEQANYVWVGPNGFGSTQQNPIRVNIQAQDSGLYQLIVVVNGCSSRAVQTVVKVKECEPISCPQPFNVTISQISATQATISWQTPLPSGVCHVVQFRPLNPNLENPVENWTSLLIPAGVSSTVLESLVPGTQYSVRVRTNCTICSIRNGQLSTWSTEQSFSTLNARLQLEDNFIVNVYPNPTNSVLNIVGPNSSVKSAEITILEPTGKKVEFFSIKDWEAEQVKFIDIGHLPAGIYFIELTFNGTNQKLKTKIIKN